VLDVGVLTGTPELLEAYSDCMHVLFEPVAEFAPTIEYVYRGAQHRLVPAAVSDVSGETLLHTTSVMAGMQISHSSMTEDPAQATRRVAMVSLDDFLRANPSEPPYLLKIDIDGHEMKVLRGATETLKHTSIVIIEATADTILERVGYLTQAGFRLFDLTEPCYYDDCLWQCDAVLIRNDLYPKHFSTYEDGFDQAKYQMFR